MTQQAWRAQDIRGLTPAVDLRRAEGLFIVDGRNYAFDSHGPKSVFGNRLLSSTVLAGSDYFQGVRIKIRGGDRTFLFTDTEILEWDEFNSEYTVVFGFASTAAVPYRWTHGYLNNKIYFCHPAVGIVVLDIITDIADLLEGLGVPESPIAICIDNGRLIVIDIDFLYWSKQSDGSDFEPRLGGAGFQRISEKVAGDPIMVTSYSRGVLVWTSSGVMRSEFSGDAEVYRHRTINTELRPINSFCTITMEDDTVVILDERGLFQSKGEAPTPLGPLFNEFLLKYLQKNQLKVGQNVRLEWDELKRFIYLSVSTSFVDPIYEKAFVFYPALDKWGTFDESHYGIVPVRIATGDRADDYFGFVGDDRRLRIWMDVGSRHDSAGVPIPLDAEIQIGLIRFAELQDSMDQMTEVNQLMIGSVVSGDPDIVGVDFNLVPDGEDEDYNVVSGQEDLGFERLNYANHKTRIIGTVDGQTKFDESIPDLTMFTQAVRHYSCACVGIWHILELRADDVGEMFHLRAFELTATYAGRLS